MADITSSCTYYVNNLSGGTKLISIVTPAAAATGDTIDLNSDVAHGRGAKCKTILNTLLQDDAGADKDSTWAPATGIITLGTVVTGIHNMQVWALG